MQMKLGLGNRVNLLSRLRRRRGSPHPQKTSGKRLELVFYRGEAKTSALQNIFGINSKDALWAGIYLYSTPLETLSMNREALENLTPPYSGISFNFPTSDPAEHTSAKKILDAAGIRYDEAITSALSPGISGRRYLLTGSTLNRDLYRLAFEEIYGSATLFGNRLIFTISPPMVNPEVEFLSRRSLVSGARAGCVASTYFWRGLQLVSRELTEESVERLAWTLAEKRQIGFQVRNR